MLHSSTRALVSMAKAMLSARANGTDPLAAIEQTIGWQRLEALVEAMDQSLEAARGDRQLSPGTPDRDDHPRSFHVPLMEVDRSRAHRP
jgi:hypothetical protein